MSELVRKNAVDRAFGLGRTPGVPWNVHAEWLARGRLQRDRLVAAAAATMEEHPLLSARQATSDTWALPDRPSAPVVGFDAVGDDEVAGVRDRAVSRPFDLEREPPVRFDVIGAPDGDHVLVVADHALVDGVGIGRTTVSLMAAYAGRPGGRKARDDRWREAHAMAAAAPPPARVQRTVEELRRRALPPPVRLAPEHVRGEAGHGVAYRRLSAEAGAALAAMAGGRWAPNDVVVAGFCQAGMRWNRLAGRAPVPFTVGVPVNLRPARGWFDGVCNATLPWPVRIDPGALGEAPSPLAVVGRVSDQLRPVRAGIYSPDVRAVLAHMSARRSLSVRERYALATTTVVSTVPGADVARAGLPEPMATADVYGGAPAPPAMGMTFAVIPDSGAWRLSARYVRARHTAAGATRFLSWVDSAVIALCDLLPKSTAHLEVVP